MEWSPVPGEAVSRRVALRARRDRELARHVARALRWPAIDLATYEISCGTLSRIAADLCCRYRCVPVVFNRRRVVRAVDDPWNAALVSAHADLLGVPRGRELGFALTTANGLDAALERRVSRVKWRARRLPH